jgi:superfamily I DNA/RNA helicase
VISPQTSTCSSLLELQNSIMASFDVFFFVFFLPFLKKNNRAPATDRLLKFVEWIEQRRDEFNALDDGQAQQQSVGVFTIHASKGLEWDIVLLPRLAFQ